MLSTTLILYWVFKFSAYGIDFTDEGYYLNWISNPFLYKSSLSQFGYIYYPLYNLVDGNIAWLRRVNFFITFVLACTLVYLVINNLIKFDKINKIILCVLSYVQLILWISSLNRELEELKQQVEKIE